MLLLRMGQRLHVAKRTESRPHPLVTEIFHVPVNFSYPALLLSPTCTVHSGQTDVFTKYGLGLFIIAFAELSESFPFSLSFKSTSMCPNNSSQWKGHACWYRTDSDSDSVSPLTSHVTFTRPLISSCLHFPIIKKVGNNSSCCNHIIS